MQTAVPGLCRECFSGLGATDDAVGPGDFEPDAEPAKRILGAHHHQVEHAVVDDRVRHEDDLAGKGTAIADDEGVDGRAFLFAVVQLEVQVQFIGVPKGLHDGVDIGRPARFGFEVLVGVLDHFRVDAHSGHDDERVPLAGLVVTFDVDHAQIDVTICSGEGGTNRERHVVENEFQVSREEVTGARRHERDCRVTAADRFSDRTHRAVTTGDDDQVGAPIQRLLRDALSHILHRSLQPHRLAPAGRNSFRGDGFAQRVEVDLDRVVDDSSDLHLAVVAHWFVLIRRRVRGD